MAAVVYRGRSLRSRRNKGRQDNGDEIVTLDFSKAPTANLRDILVNLVNHRRMSKAKHLGYYNAFARLCYRYGTSFDSLYSKEEILSCLRLGLLHDDKEMRAGCLRAIRYFCQDEEAVKALLKIRIDLLIARSLDLCLDNELERIHALRLIRQVMHLSPQLFPTSLLNVVISVARDGNKEHDRMVRSCLSTLSELAFLNPELVAEYGVFSVLIQNALECPQLPRINESLLVAILYLLNHPHTRFLIKPEVDIEQLLAPFTDCHYRLRGDSSESSSEDRESQYAACKMSVATVMKSWPGIIYLCKPDGTALQSLLGVLYLPNVTTRKEIMDLIYDVFRLSVPEWTNDFGQALLSIDPSEMRESWKLSEGFVAEEGKSLLPHLAKTRPNLVENHTALLLSTFISAGLLEALIEIIITSTDGHICVRATILLGELLHLVNTILPHESGHHTHCLPTLMAVASNFGIPPEEQNRARRAITHLKRMHVVKKRGPVPCSLYLDRIVQCGMVTKEEPYKPLVLNKDKLVQAFEQTNLVGSFRKKSCHSKHLKCSPTLCSAADTLQCLPLRVVIQDSDHDIIHQAIKDSNVLYTKENFTWDWDLISTILKWPDDALKKFDEQSNQRFLRRLIYFFKPTNRLFSVAEYNHKDVHSFFQTALYFIDFLLSCAEHEDSTKLIEEFLGDINRYLVECCQTSPPHDSLFTPPNLAKSCSQYYFLFIGRFSASQKGEKFLESTGIFHSLLNLINLGCHDTYIKLIVSSMDYSREGLARELLSKALKASSESARLYTVNFMRVLLRAKVPYISNWGLELLVMQLYDQSKAVAMEALSVISEACENEANLHTLIKMRPSVLHLGHKGAMLLARFLSIPKGFRFLQDANYITQELEKWQKVLCSKYVEVVEECLNEAMTTYEKTYDGTYVRRSHRRHPRADVFVPVHLYGQLVQHKYGYMLLLQQEFLEGYFETIKEGEMFTEKQILDVKSALWAVGHIGTSVWGLGMLQDHNIIPDIIKLAEECGVFSVRGTAFYVLGLIACTRKGADILNDYGWESVRHCHGEMWPVVEDVERLCDLLTPSMTPNTSISSLSQFSGSELSTDANKTSHYPKISAIALTPNTDMVEESGRASSYSEGYSPKASFVIGSFDSRSRSNTETSGQVGSGNQSCDLDSSDQEKIVIEISQPSDEAVTGHLDSKSNLDDLSEDEAENKLRSQSLSESSQPKDAIIHPRSNSDPRETRLDKYERRTDGASVHFNIEDGDEEVTDMRDSLSRSSESNHDALCKKLSSEESGSTSKPDHLFVREQHSSSSDSWRITAATATSNKSRSDSLYTDTSSGFSSFDSSHYQGASSEPTQLTPIPSASSLVTEQSTSQQSESSKGYVHPSEYYRKLANLKRQPSLRRRYSNPVLGHVSPSNTLQRANVDYISFTSARDLQGYATLRELKRNRTFSSEADSQANSKGMIFLNSTTSPYSNKSKSLDFTFGNIRQVKNGLRKTKLIPSIRPSEKFLCGCGGPFRQNRSTASLDDADTPLTYSPSEADLATRMTSSSNLKRLQGSSGRAEYAGICLPVDISMIFQVNEGEDHRSCKQEYIQKYNERQKAESKGKSSRRSSLAHSLSQSDDGIVAAAAAVAIAAAATVAVSEKEYEDTSATDDKSDVNNHVYSYEFHSSNTCMACMKIQQSPGSLETRLRDMESDGEDSFYPAREQPSSSVTPDNSGQPSPITGAFQKPPGAKSHNSSLSDATAAESLTSSISTDSTSRRGHLSENTPQDKALLRKEVLRFIVNLSSSIGVKSAEQGLLSLKQKFASVFQDLCLYHEVSCLLAHYKFRLPARRFIQELFQGVDYNQLYKQPRLILQIEDDTKPECQAPTESDLKLESVLESMA